MDNEAEKCRYCGTGLSSPAIVYVVTFKGKHIGASMCVPCERRLNPWATPKREQD